MRKSGPQRARVAAASRAEHTDAGQARLPGQPGQPRHLRRGRVLADRRQVGVVQRGQHGDRDHVQRVAGRRPRRLQHGAAAAGVHRAHPGAEFARRAAGGGDGVRDVVELEVEEDREAGPPQFPPPAPGRRG